MSLDADLIVDRRRLKRHLVLWRILGVVALSVLALVLVDGDSASTLGGGPHVARLHIDGIIVDDPARDDAFRKILEDDHIKALVVRIDSPGGTVVGGESLYLNMRDVAKKKPVVAVMTQLATSAGYMAAVGADHIVARSGSLTGSIGVIMQTTDVTALLDKIGIKPETIKSAELKAQPNPLEPFTEKAREAARNVVMDLYDMFVDMVAERRNMSRERVLLLADGRIFTGRQAKEVGLVDALGGEDQARQWMKEKHGVALSLPTKTVEIEYETDFLRRVIQGTIGKTLFSERLRLDGPISLWHPVQ
jgi:protease IV